MITDYTGASAVASLIQQAGLSKFVISRVGSHKNNIPVYEFIENRASNERAIDVFNKWAQIADNALPYEMKLFNSLEDSQETGEEVRNKKQGKILSFTFCLNKEQTYQQQANPSEAQQYVNILIENAEMKVHQQYQNQETQRKLEEMEARLKEYEEDDEEEDDLSELNGLNNPNITNLIGMLSGLLNKKPAGTAVNGTDDQKIKLANINKAIKILAKHDEQIDTDLLLLASMAENNKVMFDTMLNTLRKL
jgi:hypothetical protein